MGRLGGELSEDRRSGLDVVHAADGAACAYAVTAEAVYRPTFTFGAVAGTQPL